MLTSIVGKVHNALLINRIEAEIENIFRKNQNGFRRKQSTTLQILKIRRIIEGVRAKNLEATLLFIDFSKASDSIHRGKMEQYTTSVRSPSKTGTAITMLNNNMKIKIHLLDGNAEFFDIVAGVL